MSRCERRCERRCEDEQMWEKMWRWADVKMSRCERRREDEQMWRWADVREDVKMSRCEDEQMWEKMWRWADVKENVKMRRCLEDVKMRRCFTDPHYWKNPALRRSREKNQVAATSACLETSNSVNEPSWWPCQVARSQPFCPCFVFSTDGFNQKKGTRTPMYLVDKIPNVDTQL